MYTKEFVWLIPNDDNRAKDGKDLRTEFLESTGLECQDSNWLRLGCSVLEMFVALSRRLAFETDGESSRWFWQLVDNVGLTLSFSKRRIDERLDELIWRNYQPDGTGGLFPLRHPHADQRQVEIWYQLNAYLLEMAG